MYRMQFVAYLMSSKVEPFMFQNSHPLVLAGRIMGICTGLSQPGDDDERAHFLDADVQALRGRRGYCGCQ